MSLEKTLLASWQKTNGLSYLLWPLSKLYQFLFALRCLAYQFNLKKTYRAPVPVVIVGNISVGGTGKTPLVIYLVELLREQGFKPAVISRGYGGQTDNYPLWVDENTPAKQCGDEPALIAQRTKVPMAVGPNRQASIELLVSKTDCDIVISDDGLQHYALARDVELCIIDATSPLENRFLLPAGPWRESKKRLDNVDMVIEHHTHQPLVQNQTPYFAMSLNALDPVALNKQAKASFNNKKIHAVAGIGNPQRFFNTCHQLGLDIIEHAFPDHHLYVESDLQFDDDLPILMTEKDAVKCRHLDVETPCYYLPVSAQLSDQFENTLLDKLKKRHSPIK